MNGDELFCEILDLRVILLKREHTIFNPISLLTFIISYGDDVFPNLRTSIQILLTIATSIASCERSFSKLKLIENYLRTSMTEERLNNLAILSIERDEVDTTNFDQLIDDFSAAKAR